MIAIEKVIPDLSMVKDMLTQYDYVDSFHFCFEDEKGIDSSAIARLFLICGPKWGNTLMTLRDQAARCIGLKTMTKDVEKKRVEETDFIPRQRVGIFKVYEKNDREIILGEDDKHLNFRVSILLSSIGLSQCERKISITTVVKFNNLLGRLYFLPVKPFHRLIIYSMMKNMKKRLDSGSY